MRSLGHQNRTTSLTIGLRNRKIQALAMMLVLCLVTFVVLAGGEAWAAEQPSQTAQPGTVQSTTMINGKVAEPVAEVTPPVKTPPVETPPAQTPLPPTNEETPPAEEPSPPPVEPAPTTPEPEPAPQPTPQPTPQRFAVVITDGEVVESEPVLTSQSAADFGQVLEPKPMSNASPDVVDPTPTPAAPAAADDGYASGSAPAGPAPDPVLPVPGPAAASEQVLPAASGLAGLVRGLVAEPAASPAAPRGDGGLRPTPADANPAAGLTPSAPVQTVPASVGGALRLPSSLGTTAASAAGTVQSAASTAASVAAEILGSLTGGSPVNSSTNSTNGTQEQQPSEGTPQPAPAPVAPPVGGSSFSLSTGGGQLGTGSGFAPLLVGILALLGTILLRRDFRTYLVSCEMPKPSSALLMPLERPG